MRLMNTRRQIKLLTFASGPFLTQQSALNKSAPAGGVTECVAWTQSELKTTEFYRDYRDILDAGRGCGYWLWKPYLIRRELELLKSGDFLIYYDVGRPWMPHRISRPLSPLLDWCERQNAGMLPGVYVPEHGPNTKWIKRECFVLMECDQPAYWHHPQVQATYSVWQRTDQSLTLVDEWLKWCTTPGILTDDVALAHVRNFPDFVDHRHDQAVITNLVIKHGIKCYGSPDVELPGAKDIDNLVDRILGNELSIFYRNFSRMCERQLRSGYLAYQQRFTRRGRSEFGG
jgi:hypothetical protein